MGDKKARYTKPTSQRDLEERLKNNNVVEKSVKTVGPADSAAGYSDEGFVGVDPVYQNYANDTDAPHASDKGAEREAEELIEKSVTGSVADKEGKTEDKDKAPATTPSTGGTQQR